jgi:hypothetical protein
VPDSVARDLDRRCRDSCMVSWRLFPTEVIIWVAEGYINLIHVLQIDRALLSRYKCGDRTGTVVLLKAG